VDPRNIAALRQLGRLYKEKFEVTHKREDLTLAMQRFEELLKYRPVDHEAKSASQMMAAQRAIEDGGWHEADSARDMIRDKEEAAALQQEQRLVKGEDEADRELKKVEEALRKEPNRAQHWIRRGDLLLQKNRFKSAEESFRKAMELNPENTFTRARLGDVKIRYMRVRLDQLKEKLDQNASDAEAKKEFGELSKKLLEFRIGEFRQRVHDQPTNMEVHQRLGEFLVQAGDYDEAMSMFQKSVADPRYRMTANQMLGKCLVAKQMYDRAINMFSRAVEGTVVMNPTVKGIYYDLGETYEKISNWSEAERAYGKIYDADVGYRDVAEKMEAVYRKAREKKG
jgi:tetratricopeptide (TPR) repeat protein